MTRSSGYRSRFEGALEGAAESPPVAGFTFVPLEALAKAGAGDTDDPSALIATAAADLAVDFAVVPASASWARDAVGALQEQRRAIVWAVDGPLWPVLKRRGVTEGLKATAWSPEELDAELDRENSRAQDEILAGAGFGVDAILVADDLAGSAGPLLSPDYFNEHLVPGYALLVATAASAGLRTVLHTDGDVRAFLPGIARAGFIGMHGAGGLGDETFERLLGAVREHGLTLLGGLDAGLLSDLPTAVHAGARASALAAAGGFIISDDGGITVAEEIEGLAAALGAAGVSE